MQHSADTGKPQLKYSDMLRFFEIYPDVSYIYENTMTPELYDQFVTTIWPLMQDKKFPTVDVCRTFNILVRICPYYEEADASGARYVPANKVGL